MKRTVCLILSAALICLALIGSIPLPVTAASAGEPLYEWNCSADWVSEHTEGKDYTGVFFGEGGGLKDYYFVKFNQATLGKNYVYIGDYDLGKVGMISFDVTNGGESTFQDNSRLVLAADKDGQQIICSFPAIAGTGWSTPVTSSALVDTDYSGPLYAIFYNEGATDGYQVDHFRFYSAQGAAEPPVETDMEADDDHSLPMLYRFRANTTWFLSLSAGETFGVLCGHSGTDTETVYLKFNQATLETSFVYIGDYDLSSVKALSYLVTNGGTSQFGEDSALLLAADPAGQTILVESKTVSSVGWDTPRTVLEFVESDYSGPVYLVFRNAGATDGYQVADFCFFGAPPASGDIDILPPVTLPEADSEPLPESNPESNLESNPESNLESTLETAFDTDAEAMPESVTETENKSNDEAFSSESESIRESMPESMPGTPSAQDGGCASVLPFGVGIVLLLGGLLSIFRKRRCLIGMMCALSLCLPLLILTGCSGNQQPDHHVSDSIAASEPEATTDMESETESCTESETEIGVETDMPAESESLPETEGDTEAAETVIPVNSRDLLTFTPASPEGQVLTQDGASPQILIQNYNESAIDALGRPLPTSDEAGLPKEGKYVGLFYFIWASEGGTVQTNRNVTEILACHPGNPNYGSIGQFHWWAEPETGYRQSNDEWVIRRDMYYFAMAGVDFIYIDFTNGYLYENGFKTLLETCLKMRAEGQMTPYIVPWTIGSRNTTIGQHGDLGDLYERYYQNEKYDDLWFRWDGKPLAIIRHDDVNGFPVLDDPEMTDFFTFRIGWSDQKWPGEREGYGKWDDNHIVNYGYQYGWWENRREAECAGIGTAGFANYGAGRSGELSTEEFVDPFGCTPTMGEGLVFEDAFRQVMEKNPETQVLLISRWNECGAQYYDVNDFGFVDQFSPEFSRDIEPVKGLFGDNYFYQMCSIIRRFKGVLPPDGNTGKMHVDITEGFAQWQNIAPVFTDFVGDTSVRDCLDTTGTIRYINKTGRNDIVESRMTADGGSIYVYARTAEAMTAPEGTGNWMLLFLDTDNDKSTGFEGYDVLINNRVVNRQITALSVWRDNVWQEIGCVSYLLEGNELMISIPRALLGLTGEDFTVNFHWLDNVSDLYDLDAWFTTGDSAPERRNHYTLSLAVPFDRSAETDAVDMVPDAQYTYMPAVTVDSPETLTPGLSMTYYLLPDDYGVQPVFDHIGKLAAVTIHTTDIHAGYGIRYADYALLFEGYVKVTENGVYDFSVICDDGAKLYIDGRLVVDGSYIAGTDTTGTARTHLGSLRLSAGYHTVRIEYAECVGNGGAYLNVDCAQNVEWLS